jgi:hypothetical protein
MTFVMMDSDGNVEELVPLWLDLGINVLHPMEIAAGMDVRAVQARFGRRVGFFGGIDKRVLAGDPGTLRRVVTPLLEEGFDAGGAFASDLDRVRAICQLVNARGPDRILMSNDICLKSMWLRYGGQGYGHVIANIIPMMIEQGLSRRTAMSFVVDNPRRLMAAATA